MELNPKIWGPNYWFVLQTISLSYPLTPNQVTKKKYYDLIQNLPLFLPNSKIGDNFSKLLDKFPITPYLDSRESFIRWVHFIHNQYNKGLGKKELTMEESLNKYYTHYKPVQVSQKEKTKLREKYIFGGILFIIMCNIIYLYEK